MLRATLVQSHPLCDVGALSLNVCVALISDGEATRGGALYLSLSNLTVSGGQFANNKAVADLVSYFCLGRSLSSCTLA